MNSKELRNKFLNFFKEKGHVVIPSASLVPENDPTVLFTTAGMQQFKRYYSYPDEAPSARITTAQKCIRTGDIDEVGDNTHLTFFEMLGNFSFGYAQDKSFSYPDKEGSYFKKEAIEMAWEFLIEVLKIDPFRMCATYFQGENGIPADKESLSILQQIPNLPRIEPQGFSDNFWSLGTENSPGGPTVEFYVDGIEIWNLVFNEFVMRNGKYEPAQLKGVDTGMGLERLLTVLNGVENVYHTDLFDLLHEELHKLIKVEDPISERIILDHIKAAVFIVSDGKTPSNKDQGYVVRRLIRRAVVKAQQLGVTENFTTKLVEEVFRTYDSVYFDCHSSSSSSPKIGEVRRGMNDSGDVETHILQELDKEETKFRRTLREGLRLLDSYKEIDGKILFDLYQSYGLPVEIAIEEANRRGIGINNSTIEQFNNLLREHQDLSRTASAGMFKGGLAQGGEMETKYHTATHLLHAALRKVLGNHVYQRGSNITTERLRFDFSHPEKMTPEQIKEVEDLVNEQIQKDLPVICEEMAVDEAKASGAVGIFDSKYGEKVKVYTIGGQSDDSSGVDGAVPRDREAILRGEGNDWFSKEICGGPHVTHTAELGHFKITKEEASSAGIRRIKAVLE